MTPRGYTALELVFVLALCTAVCSSVLYGLSNLQYHARLSEQTAAAAAALGE